MVVLKVGVIARLLGRDAAGRVVYKHHLEEVEAGLVEVVADGLVRVANPLGERRLEVGIRGDARPVLLGGCAENAAGGVVSFVLGFRDTDVILDPGQRC